MLFFTPEHYIAKFEAIPDEKWYVGDYVKPGDYNCRCALGWVMEFEPGRGWCAGREFAALNAMIFEFLNLEAHAISDGKAKRYSQSTPKARILAALKDVVRARNAK